jgi:hypothetical protein
MAIHAGTGSPVKQTISASKRTTILQSLVSVASLLSTEQLESFTFRLSDALLQLSEHSVRPAEAELSFNAFNLLRTERALFQSSVSAYLNTVLAKGVRLLETGGKPDPAQHDPDLTLVTFEEMENRVLLGNIGQALERDITEPLNALTLRMGWLLGREEMIAEENPFRPQIFVQALYEGWCKIDPVVESRRVVLRLLGPDLFLPLASILQELNAALVERSILPDLTDAYRLKKSDNKFGLPPPKVAKRDESRYDKVREWLLSSRKDKSGGGGSVSSGGSGDEDLNVPDLFAGGAGEKWSANTISVKVGPRLFGYLATLQTQIDALEASGQLADVPPDASTLRQVKQHVPPGTLTQIDENTIELLARIFDFLFSEKDIPAGMKKLIGQLQIPLLKAALIDKKFFIKEDHPARILIDKLAKSSMAWDQQKGREDPLYMMIEQIVGKVQKEFDQQMGLFTDVVSNLESFLAQEEKSSASALAEPIAEALRQERMRQAQDLAEYDIALRIDTGEVAGFVETFLETQWTRILTLAHSVEEQKPEVLVKALRVMDDLIWSVKLKNSPEQRKELIAKLPSILSLINAWLNAIKWNEPERVVFFSNLAERHAAIVRIQSELSQRNHVEQAVNIAQKASEHRMLKQSRTDREKVRDQFVQLTEEIEPGDWVNFVRNNGAEAKFKLTWISPRRSRFIFTNRQGQDPFSFTAEELAQTLRDHKASIMVTESVVDRALAVAFEEAA